MVYFSLQNLKMEKFQTEEKRWVERMPTIADSKSIKSTVNVAARPPGIKVGMTQHTCNNPRLIIEEMSLPVRAVQNSSAEQVLWVFLNTVSI